MWKNMLSLEFSKDYNHHVILKNKLLLESCSLRAVTYRTLLLCRYLNLFLARLCLWDVACKLLLTNYMLLIEGESQNLRLCYTACWGRIWIKSQKSQKLHFKQFKKYYFQKGIPIKKWRDGFRGGFAIFWVRILKFSAYAWFMISWSLSKFELI